jgi:hypothetical protein
VRLGPTATQLARVTKDVPRGATKLAVDSTAGIKAGQWVKVVMADSGARACARVGGCCPAAATTVCPMAACWCATVLTRATVCVCCLLVAPDGRAAPRTTWWCVDGAPAAADVFKAALMQGQMDPGFPGSGGERGVGARRLRRAHGYTSRRSCGGRGLARMPRPADRHATPHHTAPPAPLPDATPRRAPAAAKDIVRFTSPVASVGAGHVVLARALPWGLQTQWHPTLHALRPSVEDAGVESLTFAFPWTQ